MFCIPFAIGANPPRRLLCSQKYTLPTPELSSEMTIRRFEMLMEIRGYINRLRTSTCVYSLPLEERSKGPDHPDADNLGLMYFAHQWYRFWREAYGDIQKRASQLSSSQ